MPVWYFASLLAAGAAALAGRGVYRRRQQAASARAAGLVPVADLTHVPRALQASVLWLLADGGFERRVAHGVIARGSYDIDVTAFDLETLRSRRGEWAYLPVDPPFRIGDRVSVVACELDRSFPHLLLKRTGRGDKLHDDGLGEIATSLTRVAREALRVGRSSPSDLPPALAPEPLALELPEHWRAYGQDVDPLLRHSAFRGALAQTHRRDLVIELIESLLLVYPAARPVAGADPLADLVTSALALVDAIRVAVISPRGVEPA